MFRIKPFFRFVFRLLIEPKSKKEDDARKEFILNIFLTGFVVLLSTAFIFALSINQGDSPFFIATILVFFIVLFLLSRFGFSRAVSYVFIGIFLVIIVRGIYLFGINEPQTLLGLAMLIVMTGVLIGSRFAFIVTLMSIFCIITIGYAQINQWYEVNAYWKSQATTGEEPIMFSITLAVIAVVAWLSNREIEKSLSRARKSEAELKAERDSLEITVETRTRELKETEAEKMTQLYRFAEFGRISSGLFHDLINPLTAVSLNLDQVKGAGETKQYADRAVAAAKRLEGLVATVRKQLSRQENKVIFSLNSEVGQAIEVLSHKAMMANVAILFPPGAKIKTYGDPVKFNQVALNLIANAIDAGGKTAEISLTGEKDEITLSVKDDGAGIKEEHISKIFEPFFTTKAEGWGIGIGLSVTKRIVEKDFGGTIEVKSQEGQGSVFIVKFPKRNSI